MIDRHLNDEAFDDVLIGLGTADAQAHLARCAECRARVESFQTTLGLFNDATLSWSEKQPERRHAARPVRGAFSRPVFAFGVTLGALLLLAVPTAWHRLAPRPAQPSAVASATTDSETQIAEDNELMQAVNSAIDPDVHSVVDSYHLLNGNPQASPKNRME